MSSGPSPREDGLAERGAGRPDDPTQRRLAPGLPEGRRRRWVRPLLAITLAAAIGASVGISGALSSRSTSAPHHQRVAHDTGPPDKQHSTRPPTVPSGTHLAFNATFRGSHLDTAMWTTCYATACTNFGNPQEVEWYLQSQDVVRHGALNMVAARQPTPGTTQAGLSRTYPYRSGMVTTYRSFSFTYGYLRVVARAPASGPDLWPALWLIPVHHTSPPEIDLFEGGPTPDQALIALHTLNGSTWSQRFPTRNLSVGWHTFALDWEPRFITWSIDGTTYSSTATDIPALPMYFIADLAVDDYAPQCMAANAPTTCNGTFAIRSVQVWQR